MDYKKIFLYGFLFLVVFLLWTHWTREQTDKRVSQEQAVISTSVPTDKVSTVIPSIPSDKDIPSKTPSVEEPTYKVPSSISTIPSERLVYVYTDVLQVVIDRLGGNIVKVSLPNYPKKLDAPKDSFVLLDYDPQRFYVAQSGLVGEGGPDTPKGQALFTATKNEYRLSSNQNNLNVDLTWKNKAGVLVTKTFVFTRNKYLVDVNYLINNRSSKAWKGNLFLQLVRQKEQKKKKGLFNISSYTGASISTPNKPYKKISFRDMVRKPLNKKFEGGWAAMQQHYFLSAWIPASEQMQQYFSNVNSQQADQDRYTIGMVGSTITVQPSAKITTKANLYIGPELVDQLEAAAPNLKLTIDYGWLWFISVIIFWVLQHVHQLIGNWGWSIVIVTLLIKLAFYKLSATSYRSMAGMRKLQPRIESLKEMYGDDRQKMGQAVMGLYKKEKINPLSGCLPILIQIPVFIALYWVLLESVQLRQAPFIFWIQDLSIRDPYFILPILMGVSMFIQQRLSPPPPDPIQAKVMMGLPVIFTFLFLYFPSGLVLYWVVNNSVSILQQWYITRKFSLAPVPKKK